MSTIDAQTGGLDAHFSNQLTRAAERPFVWSAEARPLGTLRTWLNVGLILAILGYVLFLLASFSFLALDATLNPETFETFLSDELFTLLFGISEMAHNSSRVLTALGFLLTAIFHCRLVYRATRNLVLSKARGIDFSPSWAVWCHFVPFINFIMPPAKVGRIWEASHHPMKVASARAHAIIWWWALYLLAHISARISSMLFNAAVETSNYADIRASAIIDIVSAVFLIIASFLLMHIHHGIDRAQARLKSDSEPQPTSRPTST